MNPWNAVGAFFAELLAQKKAQAWYRLIFQMAVSGLASFLFVGGSTMAALAATVNPWSALVGGIGSGMAFAAIVLIYFVRSSELTKGMTFVFPAKEAEAEMQANLQTLRK